jgi:hypothetical protein
VRPRKDHRGVDLISDALPLGRLWYGEPNAASNAIGYAKFRSRSHDAVIQSDLRCAAIRSGVVCEPDTEQIHEPRLVGIAHWAFAVWQNPFRMLSSEVVMNLVPEIRDCVAYEHHSSFAPFA